MYEISRWLRIIVASSILLVAASLQVGTAQQMCGNRLQIELGALPPFPLSLAVYNASPQVLSADEAVWLALHVFNITEPLSEGQARFNFSNETVLFEVEKETGVVWYADRSKLFNVTGVPVQLPSEEEAQRAADAFIENHGFRSGQMVLNAVRKGNAVLHIPALQDTVAGPYAIQVEYGLSDEGFVFQGPGAKMLVYVGERGEIVAFYMAIPVLERVLSAYLLNRDNIGHILRRRLGDILDVRVANSTLSYYVDTLDANGSWVQPSIAFEGEGRLADACSELGVAVFWHLRVAVTTFAPTAAILEPANGTIRTVGEEVAFAASVTDGLPPYSYVWRSSVDGILGTETSYVQTSQFTTRALSTGIREGNVLPHTITFTVTDSRGVTESVSTSMTIIPPSTPTPVSASPEALGWAAVFCLAFYMVLARRPLRWKLRVALLVVLVLISTSALSFAPAARAAHVQRIIARDDDGRPESQVRLDYLDDAAIKYYDLEIPDTIGLDNLKLVVYGRCDSPSTSVVVSHFLEVNSNEAYRYYFDPCVAFYDESGTIPSGTFLWERFTIPVAWLHPGRNSFSFYDFNSHEDVSNLVLGVDQSRDYDRSTIGENLWQPGVNPPDSIPGELMAYLVRGDSDDDLVFGVIRQGEFVGVPVDTLSLESMAVTLGSSGWAHNFTLIDWSAYPEDFEDTGAGGSDSVSIDNVDLAYYIGVATADGPVVRSSHGTRTANIAMMRIGDQDLDTLVLDAPLVLAPHLSGEGVLPSLFTAFSGAGTVLGFATMPTHPSSRPALFAESVAEGYRPSESWIRACMFTEPSGSVAAVLMAGGFNAEEYVGRIQGLDHAPLDPVPPFRFTYLTIPC